MEQCLKDELRYLMKKAACLIDRNAFGQEPNYTAGFFGKLQGEVIKSPSGQYLRLHSSVSNDRGPGSAESKTGIDIGLVFQWVDAQGETYEKAILLQAKNEVESLSPSASNDLFVQCAKMSKISSSYVVMDCPYDGSIPNVYHVKLPGTLLPPPISLADYLIDYVFPCTKGDDSERVVEIAKRADRSLTFTTNSPKPKNKPRRKSKP